MAVLSGGGTSTAYRPRRESPAARREVQQKRNISAGRRAPVRRTAARKPSTPTYRAPVRRRSTSTSRSSGYRSSGSSKKAPTSSAPKRASSGRSPGAIKKVTPPKPKPPSLKDYLAGDVAYQDLLRGQQRTLGDFLADITRQRGEAKTSFADVSRSMETERGRALEAMMNEYASRGLLQSGLYGQAQGDYQQDWQNQMSQLQQGQNSLLADLLSQETNFKREQGLSQEAARQDAIRRRAQKYGL